MGDCGDLCVKCEERLQPYLDRELTEAEQLEAEVHLQACEHCSRRYEFETTLRKYVKRCCEEPMPVELKDKLFALRTQLG